MSRALFRSVSVVVACLFVMTPLAASGLAEPEPGAADHPLVAALQARDMAILENALADTDQFQALMDTPVPRTLLEQLLAARAPDQLVDAVTRAQPGPLFGVLAPEWSSGDGQRIAAMLRAAHDPATDGFAFQTDYPLLDAFVARLVLAQLVVGDLEATGDARLSGDFERMLATGEMPHGWSLYDPNAASGVGAEPVGAAAPAPADEEAPAAPAGHAHVEDLSDIPDPEPHPMEGLDDDGDGVGVLAEGESRSFFIQSCNLCGASMGAHSGPLTAAFDLGDIPADLITEASMMVHTFDVDWFVASPCGTPIEKDTVYLNGAYAGHLTGANNQWSTSTFNLDPAWFTDGSNTIQLHVDVMGNGCWRATTAWIQVDVNAEKGDVIVDEVTTDKDGYNLGDTVEITAKVHTDAEEPDPYPASLEFQLRNPAGDIPAQNTISVQLPAGGDQKEFTQSLTIPSTQQVGTPEVGTWTAVVVAFDKDGKVSDRGDHPIGVGTDLSIEKDQIELEVLDSNQDSGSTHVRVSGTFGWAAAVDEQQALQATVYVEHNGGVTDSFDESFTVPGKGSGSFTLTPRELQLDGANEPAIRIVVDSAGDVVEVNEDNNEVLLDEFGEPKLLELTSRLKGNFWAGKSLDRPNDYTATTEDPEVGKPVEKVVYEIKDAGGATVAQGESSARGQDWKWSHDVGTFAKGRYVVSAKAVTEDGVESEPKELEFWTFDPPNLIAKVAQFLSVPLLDADSPQDRGDHARYWGKMEVGVSIDLIDAALGPGADLAKAMFTALIGKRLCLNVVKMEVSLGAEWEHEALSHKSTYNMKVKGSSSANIFGKTSSFSTTGSGTWTFSGGAWDLTEAGISMSWGIGWQCNVINSLLRLIPPPTGDALAEFNEQFKIGTLLFSFSPSVGFTVSMESSMPPIGGVLPVKQATVDGKATLSITASVSAGGKVSAGATATGNGVISVGYTGRPQNVGVTKVGLCDGGCGLEVWAEVSFWWVSAKKTLVETKIFENGELIWPQSNFADQARGTTADGRPVAWDPTTVLTPTGRTAPATASFGGGTDGVLVSDLPARRTTAALAAAVDGSLEAVHDLDDQTQTVTGSPEIGRVTTNGADAPWTQAELAVRSEYIDTTPDVAVAADGTRFLVWERIERVLQPTDDPFDHLDANHVMFRTIAPDGTASEPVAIEAGQGWQFMPRIAVAADGTVAGVTWIEDGDGDITTPDRRARLATIVDGAVHDVTQLGPVGGYGDPPQVIVLPTGAVVAAYSITDGPFAGRAVLRVGDPIAGVWSDPLVVAEGGNRPDQVRLAADAGGLTVAWVETVGADQRIMAQTYPDLPTPTTDPARWVPLPNETILPADPVAPHMVEDLNLVTSADGKRHYVWSDPARHAVRTLTVPAPDRDPGAVGSHLAFGDEPVRALHEIVDLMSGDFASVDATYRPVADTVAVAATRQHTPGGLMELVFEERHLGADPALVSLATDPANPAPGSTAIVTATVRNVGGETLTPQELIVTDNGVVIGAGATPPLAPGRTGDVRFEWHVPDVPVANRLVAYVDPHGVTRPGDPADDTREHVVTLPDLAAVTLDTDVAGGAVELVGVVENAGVLASEPTTARFLDADGMELARTTLPSVPPGGAAVASAFVGAAAFREGHQDVTLVVDAGDADSANDAYTDQVDALPDLAVTDLSVGSVSEGRPAAVRTVVANRGHFASAPTELLVEVDGAEAKRLAVPALAPGESTTLKAEVPVDSGRHGVRAVVNPDGASGDARVDNDAARTSFETKPAPFAFVDQASLVYHPDGVEVRVHNGGDGLLTLEDFAIYRGAPQDRPTVGPAYVTKVDNLFAVGGVGGVRGHSTGATSVPESDIEIRVTAPDRPNSVTRLADLAPDETVSLRLDPFGTLLDDVLPHMVVTKPLVSVSSPTHPNPGQEHAATAATFAFSVAPGRTASAYSYVIDGMPDTIPDTVADTTTARVDTTLAPGTHWMHVRAQFADGWSATDHYPVHIAAADTTAPTTRLTAHMPSLRPADGSFMGTPATAFSLDARDDLGAVAETLVRIDGAAAEPYTGPIRFPVGTHSLSYHSRDEAGNVEATRTVTIEVEPTVDTRAPAATHEASPAPVEGPDGTDFVASGTLVSLSATDPHEHRVSPPSGIAAIRYTVDGGPVQTYAGAFPVPAASGAHTITYWSLDAAGNRGPDRSWSFHVDDAAPSVAFLSPATDDVVAGPVRFEVQASDSGAGVAAVLLLREGAPVAMATHEGDGLWAAEVDTLEWPLGNNDVEAVALDALGHDAADTIRVYAIGRTLQVAPVPGDVVEQHDPHRVTDPVKEVLP